VGRAAARARAAIAILAGIALLAVA
jgi:hypothetical protein